MAQLIYSCFALLAVGVTLVVISTITMHTTQVRPIVSIYCEIRMGNDETQQTEREHNKPHVDIGFSPGQCQLKRR